MRCIPSDKMRIWIITSSFPLNPADARAAAGLFVKDFAVAVAEADHEITVITPDKLAGEKVDPPGVRVHWFAWRGGHKTLSTMKPYHPGDALAMLSLFRQGRRTLEKLYEGEAPDHVLAMWAVPAGYLAMGLKARHGVPFTTWCLGSDIWVYGKYPILRGVVRRVLRESDLIFADGLQLAENAARLAGCPCPFLASSRRLNRTLIQPLNLPDNGTKFLFIGRYAPVKGVDVLLEAMAEFARRETSGHLYMFGGGPLASKLHERAARPDLRGRVTIGGYADDATAVSYLSACDYVVIPSRMESIPVILSDALQMGKPLIVSGVGDMGRLLREQPAGLVVPPEDSAALCDAMIAMATGERRRYDAPVSALADRFDVARTAREWLNQIEPLMKMRVNS